MADRLSWWVIPGALVVLARVVTIGAGTDTTSVAGVARDAAVAPDQVLLQDATGSRSAPLAWGALTATALVVTLPAEFAGELGSVTIWRRLDGQREAEPWLSFDAKVRDDATVPIAGLAAGTYDLRVGFGADTSARAFALADVQAPGQCTFAAPPAVR